jgi:hypothetical protein
MGNGWPFSKSTIRYPHSFQAHVPESEEGVAISKRFLGPNDTDDICGCENQIRSKMEETYVHSCHSMATGENKARITEDLALALDQLLLVLASHLIGIHHRPLLLTNKTLFDDGRTPGDAGDAAMASMLAIPTAISLSLSLTIKKIHLT